MTLSGKMDDTIYFLILHKLIKSLKVTDIHLHKLIVWFVLNVLEICKVTGIRQLVEIDDAILWILVYKKANYMTANETGSACNDNIPHICIYFIYFLILNRRN